MTMPEVLAVVNEKEKKLSERFPLQSVSVSARVLAMKTNEIKILELQAQICDLRGALAHASGALSVWAKHVAETDKFAGERLHGIETYIEKSLEIAKK